MNQSLFTDKDRDIAKEYLVEYLLGNNRQEQLIRNSTYQKQDPPTQVIDMCNRSVEFLYGDAICSIANCLKTQDMFFSNYMPHWIRYIDSLGLKGYCHYIKSRDIIMPILLAQSDSHNFENLILSNKELANPLNIFYKGYFTIQNCTNKRLIEALDKCSNNPVAKEASSEPCDVTIKVLPSSTPISMEGITRILHRYA